MTTPPQWQPGQRCTCPAKAALCNLTDCQQPWAVAYRKRIQRQQQDPVTRAVGIIVDFLIGLKPW